MKISTVIKILQNIKKHQGNLTVMIPNDMWGYDPAQQIEIRSEKDRLDKKRCKPFVIIDTGIPSI